MSVYSMYLSRCALAWHRGVVAGWRGPWFCRVQLGLHTVHAPEAQEPARILKDAPE